MSTTFGLASGALTLISYLPYTKDILARKVKPERASWLIWSVTGGIAFFSQLASGATNSLWFLGLDCLGSLLIFGLSIRYGFGDFNKQDARALKLAGLGLILWVLSSNSTYALIFIIIIDAIGGILTAWKAFEHPDTETYSMWLILWAASGCAILSVGVFNAKLLAYPFYFFVANFIIIASIFIGRRVNRPPKSYATNASQG